MKNLFFEYNPKSKTLIKSIWENAVIVFDSNVLLNLYRYSNDTSDKFIQIISSLSSRIWIPFQVGFEFNKNRLKVISEQKKKYVSFEERMQLLVEEIKNKNRNPFFSQELANNLVSVTKEIESEIESKIKLYDEYLIHDPLLEKINTVFNNKVGPNLNREEFDAVYKEGELRYDKKIPPGYCDAKKAEKEKFGDLIIWKQIIKNSKTNQSDVLFVLDDRKEDWWFEHQGKTISPRPELLKEFKEETEKNIHFYKPFQFLEYSNEYLDSAIKQDIIEEVKNYKKDSIENSRYIQIRLTLQGAKDDFEILINDMKNTGYSVFTESNTEKNIHVVDVVLPNIPDLERRLNSKYISNLSEFNIEFISSKKIN